MITVAPVPGKYELGVAMLSATMAKSLAPVERFKLLNECVEPSGINGIHLRINKFG